jgi:thiol-disulfide isomerase/thioredoxin
MKTTSTLATVSVVAALAASLAGCGDEPATKETRSDVVTGSASPNGSGPAAAANGAKGPAGHAAASSSAKPAAPRELCPASRALSIDVPKAKMSSLDDKGAITDGAAIETGGKWTWINVWAGWCGPCRAEIPRIRSFEDRLAKDGAPVRVAFVSIDEDPREATRAMAALGMKSSYYLGDADAKNHFLQNVGVSAAAVPMQIFVDPSGTIRCSASGEINDDDYAAIKALVSKK